MQNTPAAQQPPNLNITTMLLLDWLIQRYPTAKRQTLKRMVEEGRVRIGGIPARKLKQEITESQKIAVDEKARPVAQPAGPEFPIIHEDADVLVVYKEAGLLTSTVPREPRPTLLAMVRDYMTVREPRARVGLIHRLDRDASGLLVFSKNQETFEALKKQFFDHTVDRVYTAIVEGKPSQREGKIRSSLVELADGSVRSTKVPGKGQIAVTDYVLLKSANRRSMLRVVLETGRKHQIRVHLSERGTPIVNDPLYGGDDKKQKNKDKPAGRLMLDATSLCFTHPATGKRMLFEQPMPSELKEAIEPR
jgi:23S rRNA pseudouridine1911/1915/1917 synthase